MGYSHIVCQVADPVAARTKLLEITGNRGRGRCTGNDQVVGIHLTEKYAFTFSSSLMYDMIEVTEAQFAQALFGRDTILI